MKLKLTPEGHAVVKDGKPVYVHTNGREEAFDAPGAMKILIGKHFAVSPVMDGLKIPADVAAAAFGDSFRIEGGKLVALDKNGIQMYSDTRHGEAATFDEALSQLVDKYPSKEMIMRTEESRQDGKPTQTPTGPGPTVTRQQFDSMPQATRAKFLREGGRVGEGDSTQAASQPAGSDKGGRKMISRAQFDAMPQVERFAYFGAGGGVSD